jgi:predicted N-formylglutamate amidohydrolase
VALYERLCNREMMNTAWIDIKSTKPSPFLIIADHASRRVPDDIDLGIDPEIMAQHVAVDIGVEPLCYALASALQCPAILGAYSRLVIDLNRDLDVAGLIPEQTDGIIIPGNALNDAQREARIDQFWRPYHQHIEHVIAATRPKLLISVHSFTPQLNSEAQLARPWHVGVLYNQDDRAARIAIPLLERHGLCVGDQQPYSGKVLNATMNRHGEGNNIAYLGLEVRQDQIADDAGVARWADILCPIIEECGNSLA